MAKIAKIVTLGGIAAGLRERADGNAVKAETVASETEFLIFDANARSKFNGAVKRGENWRATERDFAAIPASLTRAQFAEAMNEDERKGMTDAKSIILNPESDKTAKRDAATAMRGIVRAVLARIGATNA